MPLNSDQKRVIEYAGAAGAVAVVGAVFYWITHQPSLILDNPALVSGGYAVWNASNLNPDHVYIIGPVLPDGSLYYDPNTDTIAGVDSAHGVQTIIPDMVGGVEYVIYDYTTQSVVASTVVTVTN